MIYGKTEFKKAVENNQRSGLLPSGMTIEKYFHAVTPTQNRDNVDSNFIDMRRK